MQVGKTVTDKGYVSTSRSKEEAKKFGYGSSVSIDIKVPKGTKALYMPRINPRRGVKERELLLDRNTKYKVVKRTDKDGITKITLEIVL